MSPLLGFLVFVLLALVAWLFLKHQDMTEKMGHIEARVTRLYSELSRLAKERKTGPSAPPEVPPPLPVNLAEPRLEQEIEVPLAPVAPASPEPPPLTISPQPIMVPRELAPEPCLRSIPGPAPVRAPASGINWESFLGVKLFAWVGGLALFLGVAFFVKYSFENNLISPQLRVAIGYLVGLGLIGGGLWLSRARHVVTVQTLCATGILILYANIYASHAFYKFFGQTPAFGLMVVVTAAAFALAVRLDAQVVAVLGLLGGFLTPPLLGSNVDKAAELFAYIGLLDAGLLAIALKKRWNYLTFLAAVATAFMQLGWVLRFFAAEKIYLALGIFLGFTVLFVGAFCLAARAGRVEKWISASGLLPPMAALGFVLYLLAVPYPELAARPGLLFSFLFLADLGFLIMAGLSDGLRPASFGAGGAIFFLLTIWTARFLTPPLLNAALGFYLLFALLHSIYPVALQRVRPAAATPGWIHLFPSLALLLILVPLFKLATGLTFLVWPAVLLLDLVAIVLAILTASLVSILAVFLLTVLATALWIFQLPSDLPQVPAMLLVIGGFAIFFMGAALVAGKKLIASEPAAGQGRATGYAGPETFFQIVGLAAMLPFLLLAMVVLRLPLTDPSSVFGLGMVLLALFLGVLRFYEIDLLAAVGLGSVLMLECAWHFTRFSPERVWLAVAWYAGFSLLLFVFPFLLFGRLKNRLIPWAVSALAFPLHFALFYRALLQTFPRFSSFGLLPAVLLVPCGLGLVGLLRGLPKDGQLRQAQLALFGGATLFFITLIFPIQFERQWLTISWALEGAALLWLFHRLPHPGLRAVGVGLLLVSFARLALNPWVISEYGRSGRPILNWYLYAYGIVTACLLLAARLLAPPRHRLGDLNVSALLYTLGSVLAFLLMNIEIVDYFSPPGNHVTFNFSASFGQDMAYSLAWGLFAFVLLSLGFKAANRPTRYAGMGLLVVTLLKLFLHDLWRLGGLYRIGSLIGLAVLLILVSFIYQRFLTAAPAKKQAGA